MSEFVRMPRARAIVVTKQTLSEIISVIVPQDVAQWYEVDVADPTFFAEMLRDLPGANLFGCCADARIGKLVRTTGREINAVLSSTAQARLGFI